VKLIVTRLDPMTRRDAFLEWCDAHPVLSRVITVAVGLAYLWALVGATVQR
jgi:hypothetical protein